VRAADSGATDNGTGSMAGSNSGGTLGNCTLLTTVAGCAECNTHSVAAAWASGVGGAIGIALQAALMAVSVAGIVVAGHTYAANATCWHTSDRIASSVSRRRVRRVGRKPRVIFLL
jgi:hypothetical protein